MNTDKHTDTNNDIPDVTDTNADLTWSVHNLFLPQNGKSQSQANTPNASLALNESTKCKYLNKNN